MRLGPLVTSLLGSFGGRALGGALGGRTGSMIGSIAGSLLGGSVGNSMRGGRGGGLASILGGVLGGAQPSLGTNNQGGQSGQGGQRRLADAQPVPDLDDDHALVLIKAMCSAAKSDGKVDEAEIAAITKRLGDLDADEEALLRKELSGPIDLGALAAAVPSGFESEVYGVSLLAIDQVSGPEAEYLSDLAVALGLTAEQTNEIKRSVGASA